MPAVPGRAALTARAKFVAGESVLILGATGIAGHLAVQIARRLGAVRVIAAGRNPEALQQAAKLGADATISLEQDPDALIVDFRKHLSESKIDVVLDYLWGAPAESVLAAISQKGLAHESRRIRFVQIGNSAGPKISLAGATLRSSGLELLGSGFGSASLQEIMKAVDFYKRVSDSRTAFPTSGGKEASRRSRPHKLHLSGIAAQCSAETKLRPPGKVKFPSSSFLR